MLMRAIVRDEEGVALRRVPKPRIAAPDDVIVAVAVAGVCRTDLRVADGALGGRRVILGHEVAGVVYAAGAAATHAPGTRVAIVPFVAGTWLGVDLDGGFADFVRVPDGCLRRIPPGMPMTLAAYVEPVAAAMGALRAGIAPGARVLVSGANRIAELTARVLVAHGARVVRSPDDGLVDVAVETDGALAPLIAALRTGGTLIVKSRTAPPAVVDVAALVAREISMRGLGHGSFEAAIDWLATGRIEVADLLAPPRPLEAFAEVLGAARASEATKQLFEVGAG